LYNFSEKLKKYSFKQLFVLQIRLRIFLFREGEFIFCEGIKETRFIKEGCKNILQKNQYPLTLCATIPNSDFSG